MKTVQNTTIVTVVLAVGVLMLLVQVAQSPATELRLYIAGALLATLAILAKRRDS